MENNFWKEWIKLVIMLLAILGIWIGFIYICDRYFGKSFEDLRFVHYFIFMVLILKAKDVFLKRINKDKENEKNDDEVGN